MTVAGYSYFLPGYLRGKISQDGSDNSVKLLEPKFSSRLNCDNRRVVSVKMAISDDGCVSFLIREGQLYCRHIAVCFLNNSLHTFRSDSLIEKMCSLNPQGDVAISVTKNNSNNRIFVKCKRLGNPGDRKSEKNLNFDFEFRSYNFCLSSDRTICIFTAGHSDSYIDILSHDESLIISHKDRVRLPDAPWGDKTTLYFSICCTKLFILEREQFIAVSYSLTRGSFGPIFHWDDAKGIAQSFYAYHKDIGDLMIINQLDGMVKALREHNSHMLLLQGGEVDLTKYGFPDVSFVDIIHIDYFDGITIFFYNLLQTELFIFDYLKRRVVGKFITSSDEFIFAVNTNWSGEEVFILTVSRETQSLLLKLHVLVTSENGEVPSLKCLAKLAVFQFYSFTELKEMNFPKVLKREMKLLF